MYTVAERCAHKPLRVLDVNSVIRPPRWAPSSRCSAARLFLARRPVLRHVPIRATTGDPTRREAAGRRAWGKRCQTLHQDFFWGGGLIGCVHAMLKGKVDARLLIIKWKVIWWLIHFTFKFSSWISTFVTFFMIQVSVLMLNYRVRVLLRPLPSSNAWFIIDVTSDACETPTLATSCLPIRRYRVTCPVMWRSGNQLNWTGLLNSFLSHHQPFFSPLFKRAQSCHFPNNCKVCTCIFKLY